jgi:hypothetical protein
MRLSGVVESAEGLGAGDHVCWSFEDPDAFHSAVVQFLGDGLLAGQRVMYVAESADVAHRIATDEILQGAWSTGSASVDLIEQAYGHGSIGDPYEQVAVLTEATEQALADGYTGLRVAANATSLVGTPRDLDAFARYEHLVDRMMTAMPLTGMCGFDRVRLDRASIEQLSVLHPLSNRAAAASWRLHPSEAFATGAELSGEIDLDSRHLLRPVLSRVELPVVAGEITIDARHLSFADHQTMVELNAYSVERDVTTVLRAQADSMLVRLMNVLDLPRVRVTIP